MAQDKDEKIGVLRRTALLSALPGANLAAILAASRECHLARGEVLFEEGDAANEMFVVLAGQVGIVKHGKRVATGRPGQYFGEVALILSKGRSATVHALTDSVLLEIPGPLFQNCIVTNKDALVDLVRTLSERSRGDLESLAEHNRRLQEYADEVEQANRELLRIRAQLEEKNRLLERLSTLDTLTAIANRRRFDTVLEQEWKRASRDHHPLSLIYCDIDYFKGYNDTYGHQAGDECLVRVARVLSEAAQRPADLVARYGGEEFLVLLVHTETDGAYVLAERMRTNIEALAITHRSSAVAPCLTASFGVATLVPQPELRSADLIDRADHALYAAKRAGRNRVVAAPAIGALARA